MLYRNFKDLFCYYGVLKKVAPDGYVFAMAGYTLTSSLLLQNTHVVCSLLSPNKCQNRAGKFGRRLLRQIISYSFSNSSFITAFKITGIFTRSRKRFNTVGFCI